MSTDMEGIFSRCIELIAVNRRIELNLRYDFAMEI